MKLKEAKEILKQNGYSLNEAREHESLPLTTVLSHLKGLDWKWQYKDFEQMDFAIKFWNKEDNSNGYITARLNVNWETGEIFFIAYPGSTNGDWASDIMNKIFGKPTNVWRAGKRIA